MLGGPGTGKSTLALDLVTARLQAGLDAARVQLLVPTRLQADRLRDELALTSGVTFSEPVVRTYSAYAFDLLRRAREAGLMPLVTRPPRLLSGPEQDALIGELLAGHADGMPGPSWPESLGDAVGTRGFRRELREFLDRVAEHGLDAPSIRSLAKACGIPEWEAAADFVQEYRDVAELGHPEAFEPAELVALALRLLETHPSLAHAEADRIGLLVVDDLQEATASQFELVRRLATGHDALLLASPDTVVQGFRGARPDLVRPLIGELGVEGGAPVEELRVNHRLPARIGAAVRRTARRIPSALGERGRLWEDAPSPQDPVEGFDAVDQRLVESAVHRDRLVSRHVLEAHLSRGVAYEDIAVIVRNGSQVRSISRSLGLDGISTEVPPVEIPLREEAAVRPLLRILELGLEPAEARERGHREAVAAAAAIESLLVGPYGRATSLDVRALRQVLLTHERAEEGERSSTELLASLLDGQRTADELRELGPTALPAVRLVDMLAAAREHVGGEHTPSTALWAVWEAARAAAPWREQALNERGLRADRANRDLDAVMALFQAAERFGDQFPGAGLARFLEHVNAQDLPMDSLARTGAEGGRVKVLTPAAAAGGQWDTVIVTGLEEGLWPSTGLRGQLLRSDDLATVAEYGVGALRESTVAQKVREVRDDELRQFVVALSRATSSLHLVAISGVDDTPSSFMDLVREPHAPLLEVSEVPRPRTLTTLTALLRRTLEEHADERAADAAGVLALLSLAEPTVTGADPSSWWGLAPLSSRDPIVAEGATVRVSPSKVEGVLTSPLNWFMGAAGGVAPVDFARSLGTLIHSIAEDHPDADAEELIFTLNHRWDELQMPENWQGATEKERAERMLTRTALYFASMQAAERKLVARERSFAVNLPARSVGEHPVRLTGSIDRLEADAEGRAYVVDLKTGKVLPTAVEAQQHPQLATYQAAVMAGALEAPERAGQDEAEAERPDGAPALGGGRVAANEAEHPEALTQPTVPAGAALVGVGRDTAVKPSVLQQAPIDPAENWALDIVADAAALMSGSDFVSLHEQGGTTRCTLAAACPICAEGRQVTEP